MRRLSFFLLFSLPFCTFAQEITGIWQGHFRSNLSAARNSIFDERYRFEVQIAQQNKVFQGVTYSYLSSFFYGKAEAAGTINVRTGKVLLQEGKLLEVRNSAGEVCVMTCFLQYSKSGDEEFLEGTYTSMNIRDSSNCGRGTVFLRKVPNSDFYEEPIVINREKEIEKAAANPPATRPKQPVKDSAALKTGTAKTGVNKPANPNTAAKTGVNKPANPNTTARTGVNKPASPAGSTAKSQAPNATAKTSAPVTGTNRAPAHHPVTNGETHTEKNPPLARVQMPKEAIQSPGKDSADNGARKITAPPFIPKALQERANPVVKSLVVHANEITLNIYDDGVIDHDTISVYLDKKLVISHAMLTDRPLVLTLHMDESIDFHEVVMVAENEGEIPPNTSLMIIKAGDKEYEVRITSTEQKNAVVTFKYQK
jgi:hypothetical protein